MTGARSGIASKYELFYELFLFYTFYLKLNVFSSILWAMSIDLQLRNGSLALRVLLKDAALTELQNIILAHRQNEDAVPHTGAQPVPYSKLIPFSSTDAMMFAKDWLLKHTAFEALGLIGWRTSAEKIVILGAFHEAKFECERWLSADMASRFSDASEPFPLNFARDAGTAIKKNLITYVTRGAYKVSPTGWSKIAEAISAPRAKLTTYSAASDGSELIYQPFRLA